MMFEITRGRLAGILSGLTITFALVVVLASVAFAGGPIAHSVSAGGPDLCSAFGLPPGCNANFTLSAREYADGTVKGHWSDQFGHGGGGFHADIDCLVVAGDEAWVSGVITHGVAHTPGGDIDLVGFGVSTRVKDNGTSMKDVLDELSFTFIEEGPLPGYAVCTDEPDYPLWQVPEGQVKVD